MSVSVAILGLFACPLVWVCVTEWRNRRRDEGGYLPAGHCDAPVVDLDFSGVDWDWQRDLDRERVA